ncbi:MAG: PAS domain S-box protein [Terracidiphilus sp.]|jgi:PAS domain S-box-containing protein
MAFTDSAEELKHLQRGMSDLVSMLALPAVWNGQEPRQIVTTFHDALLATLNLEFVYTRARTEPNEGPIEILRTAPAHTTSLNTDKIHQTLNRWFGDDPQRWPTEMRGLLGGREISLVPMRLGIAGEIGIVVAGSERTDFPTQTERLLLGVATNQAAVGLQQTLRLNEQKRVASELDRRVAERTRELAEINAELQLQVGLLQHLPVSAWTLKPDGTPDYVNQVWLDFSGQTLDFVRSHPEAWMTAVHPEDREKASKAFWDGVRSGQGFAVETRSLRARDGTYRWHLQQAVVLRDAEGKVLKFVGTTTDIDEQKRAEEGLRASEANLRQTVDGIPGLVCTLNSAGQIEHASRPLLDFFGMMVEELNSWGTNGAVHPDDLQRVTRELTHSLKTGTPYDSELRYRRADGLYRWSQTRILPLRDAEDRITRWYGLITDIDDRKRVEEELRRSEARKTAILDSALDCVVTIDHEGCITEFNPAAERTFGYRRNDVMGRRLSDVMIPPSQREKHRQGLARYRATGEARLSGRRLEMTAVRADGTEFPVELAISRISMDGPPSFTGYLRDITERKQAEEELRRSEAFLAEGQRLSRTGSFFWRVATAEIIWSEQLYRIFELDPASKMTLELIGSRIHPENLYILNEMVERAQSGSELEYEYRLLLPDNSVKYLHVLAHGTMNHNGQWEYVGAVQDITERRLSEEALTRARAELAHVARITSLGVLTASIAHEVNQPLSGIVMNASTCLRMLDSDPPNIDGARETARRTIRDGNRASEVVTRLRTLFKRKEVAAEPVDLNDAAREVIALSLGELQSNRIVVRQDFAENLPAVTGDRTQLQQVILNLLRNASDAMRDVDDRPRQLLIKTENDGGKNVRLTVQDSGIGFVPDVADRLFESFYTTKENGMGVGLSVSRSIIEAHRGRLWASANDGPGASFAFSIPQDRGAEPA